MSVAKQLGFYEFFAGGGMARIGLGKRWRCLMANDVCEKKVRAYQSNFNGAPELIAKDVAKLTIDDLPKGASLAWASFPCQDLSLAGNRAGLSAARSGTLWPFWRLVESLARDGRPPDIIVLENVVGAITSHKGRDFRAILGALATAGYKVGALVINAAYFVPQSRPRLFVVAVKGNRSSWGELAQESPSALWHPASLRSAYRAFPESLKKVWAWWRLPIPQERMTTLTDIVEDEPVDVQWHTEAETKRLIRLMSSANRKKLEQAQSLGVRVVGTLYKRTRCNKVGRKVQRAEVRFDQISGCLRTPAGGSSRQTILVVEGLRVRSRLLSSRETARLMGVPDEYRLPSNYNEAYHLMGDGVAVPVVAWLEKNLLWPLASIEPHMRVAA
jgi:DNA (cytosine-5)-methyltransferase 1